MKKAASYIILFFVWALFLFPSISLANPGVGIGPGKIEINKPFKPGGLYALPPFTVINTGDEDGDYELSVEYQSGQDKLSPARDWFVFSPNSFHLGAGQSQLVEIHTNIPLKAVPGDYFAFLSAHPILKNTISGNANMQISAASKMYFTIAPANIFQAIYYRLVFTLAKYKPWSYIIIIVIIVSILLAVLSRFITLNIGIGKKRKNKQDKVTASNSANRSDDIDDILSSTLHEVEKYTSQLSEKRFEEVFAEARTHRQEVMDFFHRGDPKILQKVSPELKNILLLSKEGIESVKYKDKGAYEKMLKIIVSGIVEK